MCSRIAACGSTRLARSAGTNPNASVVAQEVANVKTRQVTSRPTGSDVADAVLVDPAELAPFRLTPKAVAVIERALTMVPELSG